MQKFFVSFLILTLIFTSNGCGGFYHRDVETTSAKLNPLSKEINNVFVYLKQYDPEEGEYIYDEDFRDYPFQPVYISIFNNSEDSIEISANNFKNYFSSDEVYDSTKNDTSIYFLFWVLPTFASYTLYSKSNDFSVRLFSLLFSCSWLIVGGIQFAISILANWSRTRYLEKIELKTLMLGPGDEINGVVFVDRKRKGDFQFSILTQNGEILEFNFVNENKMMTGN